MDIEKHTLSERSGRAIIDDLNRNIALLRQLGKLDDIGAAEFRTMANCLVALCLTLRTVIQVEGLQSVRSE